MMERFDYSLHRSREKAALAIEDYFAAGEIDNSDRPQIEKRFYPGRAIWYAVSLVGYDRPNAKF
jgi:hypothetical protein